MYQCSTYFFEVRSLVHFLHTWCIKVRNRVSQFSMTFNGRFLRSRYMPFPWNGMTEEMSICGKSIELVKQQTKHINWGIINWGRESTLTHLPGRQARKFHPWRQVRQQAMHSYSFKKPVRIPKPFCGMDSWRVT